MMQNRDELFEQVFAAHRAGIQRICQVYLYDRSHAQDLFQEIFFQVWKSLEHYRGEAAIGTWVYRIAVNTAISYNRKNSKAQYTTLPDSFNEIIQDHPASDNTDNQLVQLRNAIRQLEQQDQFIITLLLEGLSYKDIAEVTGSNTNHIGVKITRIKSRLSKLMSKSAII